MSKGHQRALARRRKRSEKIDLLLEFSWGDGGSSGDDFTVRTPDGYTLRVEQMDRGAWWWQVYYPDGKQADPWCDLSLPTEYTAKRVCELVYKLHRAGSSESALVSGAEVRPSSDDRAIARGEANGGVITATPKDE